MRDVNGWTANPQLMVRRRPVVSQKYHNQWAISAGSSRRPPPPPKGVCKEGKIRHWDLGHIIEIERTHAFTQGGTTKYGFHFLNRIELSLSKETGGRALTKINRRGELIPRKCFLEEGLYSIRKRRKTENEKYGQFTRETKKQTCCDLRRARKRRESLLFKEI